MKYPWHRLHYFLPPAHELKSADCNTNARGTNRGIRGINRQGDHQIKGTELLWTSSIPNPVLDPHPYLKHCCPVRTMHSCHLAFIITHLWFYLHFPSFIFFMCCYYHYYYYYYCYHWVINFSSSLVISCFVGVFRLALVPGRTWPPLVCNCSQLCFISNVPELCRYSVRCLIAFYS